MKNLIKLAKALSVLNLNKEAATVAALARNNSSAIQSFAGSQLRRMQVSERLEGHEGILSNDAWALWVAEDLSDKLSLHSPAFIGASDRDPFVYSYGAYAFSASNDNGESVVLKIGPADEIGPYKKIIDMFGANPPSIVPKVFEAKTFAEIGYVPPEGISKPFSYIIMEELEKMPANMSEFLQSPAASDESFRILMDTPGAMSNIIQKCCDESKQLLNKCLAINNPTNAGELTDDLMALFSEKIFNKIKFYKSSNDFNYLLKDIYRVSENVFLNYIDNKKIIEFNLSFEVILKNKLSLSPVRNNYDVDTSLGKKVKTALIKLKNLGINPNDLHEENIMIRPNTGEIVISDLGHFTFDRSAVNYEEMKTEKVFT